MKPDGKKTVNLRFVSVRMSPPEILTHQIDSGLKEIERGPKRLRSRLGRERRHELTLRFYRQFGNTEPRWLDTFHVAAETVPRVRQD